VRIVWTGAEAVELVGWGLVQPGQEVELPDEVARELLDRPGWVRASRRSKETSEVI